MVSGNPPPVWFDNKNEYPVTLIAFGSMYYQDGLPPFQWVNALHDLEANKLFVRDLHRRWYLRGLGDMATNPQEAALYLRGLIGDTAVGRTITVGESMGGYAALLFAALLGSAEAHAFAPQTFLPGRKGRIWWQTVRRRYWAALLSQARLQMDRRVERSWFDLRPWLAAGNYTKYHIYYAADNPRDVQHAQHVAGLPGTHLHQTAYSGHHVARAMREADTLRPLLDAAIERTAARPLDRLRYD